MANHSGPLESSELEFLRAVSAHGARTWLIAQGLIAVLGDLRERATDTAPIPVPGMRPLLDQITAAVTDATNLLDAAVIRAERDDITPNRGAGGRFAPGRRSDRDRAGEERVPPRLKEIAVSIAATDRFARQIAQLVLGATSYLPGTDDVARLERAGVEVLAPVGGPKTPLSDDGVELFAVDRDQLQIEVAGMICRLLIDWGGVVVLTTPGGAMVRLEVTGDTLRLWAEGVSGEPSMSDEGWSSEGPDSFARSWASPVTVAEPASEIVRIFFEVLKVPNASELTAELPIGSVEHP
jgi:hypothetical protein